MSGSPSQALLESGDVASLSLQSRSVRGIRRPLSTSTTASFTPATTNASTPSEEEGPAEDHSEFFVQVLNLLESHQERSIIASAAAASDGEGAGARLRKQTSYATGLVSPDRLHCILRQLRLHELPEMRLAIHLVEQTRDHLAEECSSLMRIERPSETGRIIVVGDLHGHFNDLLRILDRYGEPSPTNVYLFNGDFVDRGDWGLEVLLTLFCLRLLHPGCCFLNRGNHECQPVNEHYGFRRQVVNTYPKMGEVLYAMICEACDQLPLAYVVGNEVFVVHAGLPLEPCTLDDIAALERGPMPIVPENDAERLFQALLWSDPASESGPSCRGAGVRFDEEVTQRFLETNGLACILRSHECMDDGVAYHHHGLVTTVFSASNYNAVHAGNSARVLVLNSSLKALPSHPWHETYHRKCLRIPSSASPEMAARKELDIDEVCEDLAVSALAAGPSAAAPAQVASTKLPHERALGEIYRLINFARPLLLEAFEDSDPTHSGTVTENEWIAAMRTCLGTPGCFPWSELRPFLCRLDGDGSIRYVEFLLRYHSLLADRLADRWASAALGDLAEHLGGDVVTYFDQLDISHRGCLSYGELRAVMNKDLPGCRSEARLQSNRGFALFRRMDLECTGFVTRQEFATALSAAAVAFGQQCPSGHRLEVFEPEGQFRWCCFGSRRFCDQCLGCIWRDEPWHGCVECDYDLCVSCVPSSTRAQEEWESLDAALRIISRSHTELRALFCLPAQAEVTKKTFDRALRPLLARQSPGSKASAYIDLFWDSVRQLHEEFMSQAGLHSDDAVLRIEDLERYMTIRDAK